MPYVLYSYILNNVKKNSHLAIAIYGRHTIAYECTLERTRKKTQL